MQEIVCGLKDYLRHPTVNQDVLLKDERNSNSAINSSSKSVFSATTVIQTEAVERAIYESHLTIVSHLTRLA